MIKRPSVYLSGVVLVTALALVIDNVSFDQPIHNPSEEANSEPRGTDTTLIDSESATTISASQQALPSSLQGTHHGVTLRSHNQQFIITASLKDLFDYYLSAAGEDSFEDIEKRILADLARQLSGDALDQVNAIWKNYLAYKTQLVQFDQQFPANSEERQVLEQLQFLQQRQMALIALQDQVLTPQVAEILFAFDRKLDQLTLEKAELLASDLTAEQKQQGLINLQAQLPIDALQGVRRNQQQQTLLLIDEDQTLTAQQKFQLRSEQVGAGAASRLQKLDEERNRWQQRIDDFKQQKKVLQNSGLASEEYLGSLDKLYTQHFAPSEQLRARALTSRDE